MGTRRTGLTRTPLPSSSCRRGVSFSTPSPGSRSMAGTTLGTSSRCSHVRHCRRTRTRFSTSSRSTFPISSTERSLPTSSGKKEAPSTTSQTTLASPARPRSTTRSSSQTSTGPSQASQATRKRERTQSPPRLQGKGTLPHPPHPHPPQPTTTRPSSKESMVGSTESQPTRSVSQTRQNAQHPPPLPPQHPQPLPRPLLGTFTTTTALPHDLEG